MSKTAFANPDVRFVAINVCELDAFKHAALPVVADARVALEELLPLLTGFSTSPEYRERLRERTAAWHAEVDRVAGQRGTAPFAQAEVVGARQHLRARPRTSSSPPRAACPAICTSCGARGEPNTYHLEYGYSCMGYEIAGGLGVKMADPSRDVLVMVGDGSYLMMAQEIVTSIQEGFKLIIVLLDSQGYASIGGLSRSLGSGGFGTQYRYRNHADDALTGEPLPVDLAANAASLGAEVHRATDHASLEAALDAARRADRTTVIHVPIDPTAGVPGYDSWWDVAVAEVSEQDSVRKARKAWETARKRERWFF